MFFLWAFSGILFILRSGLGGVCCNFELQGRCTCFDDDMTLVSFRLLFHSIPPFFFSFPDWSVVVQVNMRGCDLYIAT